MTSHDQKIPEAVYVGDIDQTQGEQQLHQFFSKYGTIQGINLKREINSKKQKNHAFIQFTEQKAADDAINQANGQKLGNSFLRVMKFRTKGERDQMANIFVKNMGTEVTPNDLKNHFSQFGVVESIKVQHDDQGAALGYGYVQFKEKDSADKSLQQQVHTINGTEIQIERFVASDERIEPKEKKTIYIKDLPENKTLEELEKIVKEKFSIYGQTSQLYLRKDAKTQKFFAFVTYENSEDAAKAVAQNGKSLIENEGPLYINYPITKEQRYSEVQENNLFTKNLIDSITEEQFRAVFSKFGKLTSLSIKAPPQSSIKQKYAHFSYELNEQAQKTIMEYQNDQEVKQLYQDKKPYISFAQSKDQRVSYQNSKTQRPQTGSGYYTPFQTAPLNYFPTYPMMNPFAFQQQVPFGFMSPFQPNQQPQRTHQPYHNNNNNGGNNQGRRYMPPANNQGQQTYYQKSNNSNNGNRGPNNYNRGGYNNNSNYRGGSNNYNNNYNRGGNNNYNRGGNNSTYEQRNNNQPKTTTTVQQSNNTNVDIDATVNQYELMLKTDSNKVWNDLGVLVMSKVEPKVADKSKVGKITGMLVDLNTLTVRQIIEAAFDEALLSERIQDALELINGTSQ